MSITYPEPAQVIPAAERSPQQWVDYYLHIEDQAAAGKEVRFDDGRVVVMEDLREVRKARAEWERRAATQSRRGQQNFGGFHYKTPDMSQ